MTWVTADTHFNHARILEFTDRPWATIEEMNEGIIERWNDVVRPNATVFHLGDFALGDRRLAGPIFDRLHGRKHLVRGNHDNKKTWDLGWETVKDLTKIRDDGFRAVACHFPLLTWDHAAHGHLMVHGHSHGTLPQTQPARLDVGIDCHPEFRPFSLEEIVDRCDAYEPVDHHG